ncbi:MAG: TonB-dependent receptor plug domain-containing protein [Muribaculaceae bacterium]|nr:TonB-dependent receptor plug domain-containing protein [Muribaculaceae bacterium]
MKRILKKYPILLLVANMVAGNLFCKASTDTPSAPPSVPENSTLFFDSIGSTLKEVEVVSRIETKEVSAVMPLQIMTSAEIEKLGITDMADAVRRFSGVNIRDYGGLGGVKTVSVRNMGASHTAVSYDGAPVDNIEGGQVDIGRFSLNNLSRLTLAVGQDNDLLQCARLYSSAAVLGITTRQPDFKEGRKFSFETKIKAGSWGYVSPYLKWSQKISDKFIFSLDGDYTHSDGNYPFLIENGVETEKARRTNSKIDNWHAEANLAFPFSSRHRLDIKGYFYQSKRGVPGAVTLYNPVSTETLWGRDAFVQMKYRGTLSNKWKIQFIGKYANGWSRERETGAQYAGGLWQAEYTQNEYFLSGATSFRATDRLSLGLAQDVMFNNLSYTKKDCPFPSRVASYTSLTAKFRGERYELTANLNGVATSESVKTGKAPDSFKCLNPSVGATWQPIEDVEWNLRAMYKKTDRLPTFNDLYYDRLGIRTLRPERADEYNVGTTWLSGSLGILEYCSITADGYYNYVNDKIVAMPSTHNWRMMNYGKVQMYGIDLNAFLSFGIADNLHLNLSGSYSWQKTCDLSDKTASNYKAQLPYSPQHSGNCSLTFSSPWIEAGYSLVGVGKCYYMVQNTAANILDGYVDQSISVGHEFKFKDWGLTLRAEMLNLGDAHYEVIKYYPMPGRSFRASILITL